MIGDAVLLFLVATFGAVFFAATGGGSAAPAKIFDPLRALLLGAIWLLASAGAYPCVRAAQLILATAPDPATIVWAARSEHLARCAVSLYAGALVALAVARRGEIPPATLARRLRQSVLLVAAAFALQVVTLP